MYDNRGMDFYERVKQLCKERNEQLITFLERIGINYGSYKSCRNYGNLPRADEAYKIASALGVSVDYLVSGKDNDAYKIKYEEVMEEIRKIAGSD